MKKYLLVLLLTHVAACTRTDTARPVHHSDARNQAPEPRAGEAPATACESLSESACKASSACKAVDGMRYVRKDRGWCTTPSAFTACIPVPEACGDAETNACAPGSADVHLFFDTCIPVGWRSCQAPAADAEPCNAGQ